MQGRLTDARSERSQGLGLSSTNDVTVSVTDVNEAPVAMADSLTIDEDATSDNLWSLLLGNDSDVDAATS